MERIATTLDALAKEHRLRKIPSEHNDRYIDLCSNDYLGLGARFEEFIEEFRSRFGSVAFSSSASRLLSMRQKEYVEFEDLLGELYNKSALLFNSGYHANVGCVSALNLPSTLFICDKLIHASIIDGLRLANAEFKRFPHNDAGKLKEIIEKEINNFKRIVVVVESIYSMDGDMAPLLDIVAIKRLFPEILLYLDEAHAFGVRGEKGLGLAEELNLVEEIDIIIGTLGKACASAGAFVIADERFKSYFINLARSFIFSTALPPVNVVWSHFMVEKILKMGKERKYLEKISYFFNDKIEALSGKPTGSVSQIIPLILGNAEKALKVGEALKNNGILALPIRRPTVPPGGERIRFSLNSLLSEEILGKVTDVIKDSLR